MTCFIPDSLSSRRFGLMLSFEFYSNFYRIIGPNRTEGERLEYNAKVLSYAEHIITILQNKRDVVVRGGPLINHF